MSVSESIGIALFLLTVVFVVLICLSLFITAFSKILKNFSHLVDDKNAKTNR